MTTPSIPGRMPERPRVSAKVRWRDPGNARAWGWVDLFGPGPFELVGVVDRSGHGLAASLVLRTGLGDREIPEVWLALADEPQAGSTAAERCQLLSRNYPSLPRRAAAGPGKGWRHLGKSP
jgi:hypothetical protein